MSMSDWEELTTCLKRFLRSNGTGSPLQEQAVLGQIQMKPVEFV
jgi:hypothetical protein